MNETRGTLAPRPSGAAAAPLALAQLDALPTPAPIALQLLRVTLDPDSDAREVISILQTDQSLAAKVLAVANSAAYGAAGNINTLNQAVTRIGFRAVRNLALAVNVIACLGADADEKAPRRFQRTDFWRHSLGVACVAQRLARSAPEAAVDPDAAYLAGLLHDLGKIALASVFPKAYESAAQRAVQERGDIADYERNLLGIDHTVAGRRVAERWGLPREFQEVIWLHHLAPESLPARLCAPKLVALVRAADACVREQRIGFSGNFVFIESAAEQAARLGFSPLALQEIVRRLPSEVSAQCEQVGLDRRPPEELVVESLARANTELGQINTELTLTNRRMHAASRYFQAITRFDQAIGVQSDVRELARATWRVSCEALQRDRLAAFALYTGQAGAEVVWSGAGAGEERLVRLPDEAREWFASPEAAQGGPILRAPGPLRSLLSHAADCLGRGALWFAPVTHDGRLAGGVLFQSERDEAAQLAAERAELSAFLCSVGLAFGRAAAYGEIRRLSEDLAETNRRLQQSQAEALRTRTLSTIAEMAAGAGHELNSPLFVISGRAELLLKTVHDPDAQRALELMQRKAHECSQIVSELMAFARPSRPEIVPTDILGLLDELRQAWLEQLHWPASRLTVSTLPSDRGELTQVPLDRGQIAGVLDELIRNAADAVADSAGPIHIDVRIGRSDDAAAVSAWRTAAPGPSAWVEIRVTDGGAGMPPAVAQRAFEPFFSHRAAGRRRGLGLARAYRVIEAHSGRIWLESNAGEGTTVHITLPLCNELGSAARSAAPEVIEAERRTA